MNYLSLFGILISMAILIYGSIKSVNMILLAGLAATIVTLTGQLDMATGYASAYMAGVGGFVTSMLPLFLMGSIFGKLMETSGLGESVADAFLGRIKTDSGIIISIFFATVVLVTAGVSIFVIIFTIYPMAIVMFKKANITKNIMPALIMGAASAQAVLPGVPSNINVQATTLCNVPELAAPITGIITFTVLTAATLVYLIRAVKVCKARGEVFVMTERDEQFFAENSSSGEKKKGPAAWLIVPPVALVLIMLNVVGLPAYLSLAIGSVLMLVMFYNSAYKLKLKEIFNAAAEDAQYIVITAAIVGFGSVVKAVPGYDMVSTLLDKVSGGNVWLFAFIAVNVLAAVSASSLSGITIAMTAWGDKLLASGVNPENMARLLTISSMGMDSLPHNSANLLTVKYCDVDAKQGHKHLFIVTCVFGTLVGVIPMITGMLGIC